MSSNPEPTGDRRPVLPARRDAGTPPPATPPKSYSVDEMLSQLRGPDGAKRKRRSEQPVYASRRRRRLVIGLAVGILALAVLAYYGFRFFQRHRLEGDTFREGVNRRVSEALGCQVELTRIHGGGENSLFATEGRFDTWDQDLLESGALSELDASLTWRSWNSNEWGIQLLSIKEGTVKFNPQRPLIANDTLKTAPRSRGREKSGSGGYRLGINAEPDVITLDAIRFTRGLDLEWPSASADRRVESIRGLRGQAKFPGGGVIEGAFIGAAITLNHLPELQLEHLQWKLTGRRLDIPGARIGLGTGDARAEIIGHADLVSDGAVDLQLNFFSTPLKTLVPAVWHERVHGKFASKGATFRAAFAKGPERVLEGDFTLTGAVLVGIGFVNKLADIVNRPDFSRLEFPELTGHYKWTPSAGMEITKLAGEKEGFLRLSGGITVNAENAVSGGLQVSVTESALRALPENVSHSFGPAIDGWASVEFTLSGTSAAINDTLPLPGAAAAPAAPKPNPVPDKSPAIDTAPRPAPAPAAPPPAQSPPSRPQTKEEKEKAEKLLNDLIEENRR